ADQRDDLALLHVEADPVQRRDRAVGDLEVGHGEERAHTASTGSPRYASITTGSARTCSGVPCAIVLPKFSTRMRSQIPITTSLLCSMRRMAMPKRSRTSWTVAIR